MITRQSICTVGHALQVGGFVISGKNLNKIVVGLVNVFLAPRLVRHNFSHRWLVQHACQEGGSGFSGKFVTNFVIIELRYQKR